MEEQLNYIELTKDGYKYVCNVLKGVYDMLSKLPRKMRTEKYEFLENLLLDKFSKYDK